MSSLMGLSDYVIGSQCGSQGGAMVDGPTHTSEYPWPPGLPKGPHCFLIAAPPIIIGDLYMSTDQAITHINTVFRVNGNQPALPTYLDLEGPLLV